MYLLPLLSLVALLLLLYLDPATSQTFIRDCNNPVIVGHVGGDTYCEHTCGFFRNPTQLGTPVCAANGMCICQCEVGVPQATLAPDLCPKASDPPDTDPSAAGNCARDCTGVCIGGISQVCGEQAPTTNAKICVCSCPPTGCPGSLPITEVPPPLNSTNIVLIPVIKPQIFSLKLLLYYFGFVISKLTLWSCLFWICTLWYLENAALLRNATTTGATVYSPSSLPQASSFILSGF